MHVKNSNVAAPANATVAKSEATAPKSWIDELGPGLIAGAADDDPSGIATYSQAGAQFGFGMLWTMVLTYPLMVAIQNVSARIGRVTGHGLATNIRRHYPAALLYPLVSLLLLANTINIAADVAAMGDAMTLVAGGKAQWYAALFGVISVLLQVFVPYSRYVKVLKWLTLALLAYVATVFVVDIPWRRVLSEGMVLPGIPWKKEYTTTIVAVFGTTISPYLFFWQASQEVEDLRADDSAFPLKKAPRQARAGYARIDRDTYIGMGFSNMVAFFIMLTTAIALHMHGVTHIETSAQAATALRPIAGNFAFFLFALGIIGTGLLAVPVLAGSAAYAIAGAFRWKNSLEHSPKVAPRFYAIIVIATLAGIGMGFAPIDPIKALYWSAVINGVIAIPIMVVMMLMAGRSDVMGRLVISKRLKAMGWLCTAAMTAAVLAMTFTQFS
jgi:NRAMP (natural resistance-associated macrophage protein)-like metal ion transporter